MGRIASYTLAARALEAADLLPDAATLVRAITADEETGGTAGAGYVPTRCYNWTTQSSRTTATASGTRGVASSTSRSRSTGRRPMRAPANGANALLAAPNSDRNRCARGGPRGAGSDVEGVDGPTCMPATIRGGTKTNVVPAACSLTVDRRVPADESVALDQVRDTGLVVAASVRAMAAYS